MGVSNIDSDDRKKEPQWDRMDAWITWIEGCPQCIFHGASMRERRERTQVLFLLLRAHWLKGGTKQDYLSDPTFFWDTYLGLTYPSANLSVLILNPAGGGFFGFCC